MANNTGAGGRPRGRQSATVEQKAEFFRLVDDEKLKPEVAAQMIGFSEASGRNWYYTRRRNEQALRKAAETRRPGTQWKHPHMSKRRPTAAVDLFAPPRWLEDLDDELRACVEVTAEGFERFRQRIFERTSKPWQTQCVADLLDAYQEAQRTGECYYLIANVFPGGGKSTTLTHDYVVWRITCARVRGMIHRVQLGAESLSQSRSYTQRVQQTFESNHRLIEAFGRYKPLEPKTWMNTGFTIDMPPGVWFDEKEPTVFAVSRESGFLGFRCEEALWDDLVSKKNSKSVEMREQQQSWWLAEAESRVNPGGLCALIGTRANRDDLFSRLKRLTVLETDEGDEVEVESKTYHVFTYPVHDASKCRETTSLRRQDHVECLNDPQSYSWRTILRKKSADPIGFELTYQQNDVDLEDQLVQEMWLTGGTDPVTGDHYMGCYDRDRAMWREIAPFALEDYRAAIVVDPSPTKYWAVEAWVWDKRNDVDYLIGMERKQMQAPELLDLKPGTLEYSGLLEEFLLKLRELRIDCYYIIMEENSAQRFMTQYAFIRHWARLRNVTIRGHETSGVRLADEHYGIETLGPRYRNGQVRLPLANPASRKRVEFLTREAMAFPDGETDDCLKAQWFFHYNRDSLNRKKHQRRYYSDDSELSPRLRLVRQGKAAW